MDPQISGIKETSEWNHGVLVPLLGGAETILFVEDEAFVRNVTSEVLRSAGYTVLTARTPAEGLVKYDELRGRVDLLLTDVILPGETGRTLARKLRLQNPALSVLFITGYPEQMSAHGPEQTEFLAKPFSTGLLLRRVRELLDCRKSWSGEQASVRRACGSA